MATLIVTRGIPGSGKSTWAHAQEGLISLSRDDIRFNLYGIYFGDPIDENYVTKVHQDAIRSLLLAGVSVIDDSTNLPDRVCKEWMILAEAVGASFEIKDFRDVPLETCLERNKLRADVGGRRVPEEVIKSMYERQVKGKKLNAPLTLNKVVLPEYTYIPDVTLPKAVLLDIDGTVADHHGVRGPYDTSLYHLDKVHEPIKEIINAVGEHFIVLAVSGRSKDYFGATFDWLLDSKIVFDDLIMRPSGDKRKDSIVKLELFQKYIAPKYNVIAAFDDRNQVVNMYRDIGLTCLQVRPGDF